MILKAHHHGSSYLTGCFRMGGASDCRGFDFPEAGTSFYCTHHARSGQLGIEDAAPRTWSPAARTSVTGLYEPQQ